MTTPMPSLIEPSDFARRAPSPRRSLRLRVPASWQARWERWTADPRDRRRALWTLRGTGAACVIGLGIAGYFLLRPTPQPDFLNDPLDDLFNYTLLTDDFNRLSVEERLKLIGQLVDRMKGMSSEDSVLLAAFAAGIAGSAREQIEANASRLAIDTWDLYARDYANVPADQRGAYLDDAFLKFSKMMEGVGGRARDVSDEQRLAEVRRDAERRKELSDPSRAPSGEMLGTLFTVMNSNVGGHATPQQRARGAQMMRDMTRHFRGQDIATGKPK